MTYCERVPFLRHQYIDQFSNINSRVGAHWAVQYCVQQQGVPNISHSLPSYCTYLYLYVSISKRRVQKSKNRSCVEAEQVTRTFPAKINGLLHFQRKTCLA
jgi:hypothetical protein